MAYEFKKAQTLVETLRTSPQQVTINTPETLSPDQLNLATISDIVEEGINGLALTVSSMLPVQVRGYRLDTTNYYKSPSQMRVFIIEPADNPKPTALPNNNLAKLGILNLYADNDLRNDELAKAIIEQRPSGNSYVIEALVKSHGETPESITKQTGSSRIISKIENAGNPYTTIKITPLPGESEESFAGRINQALETTAAGIISHGEKLARHTRKILTLAA